jgi:hypothetical protein
VPPDAGSAPGFEVAVGADETFGKDVIVAGIDVDGEVRWLERWQNDALQQDTNDRAGARVAARAGHGIAVGGGFRGELTIGDRRLTSSDPSGYDGGEDDAMMVADHSWDPDHPAAVGDVSASTR